VGGRQTRRLSQRVMGEILEPRVEEMLSLVKQQLVESSHLVAINAGLVMTGGTSLLTNMVDLAEQIFDVPVRIGYPRKVEGMSNLVSSPQFATAIGLIYYGLKNDAQRRLRNDSPGLWKRMKGWFGGSR
ncbi:MAG TPA: cell division FtsA domain-containing protein, partial [Desulfurivibrionaceae bacterium]|nr:cell division FtsA domain-containing protein [Desulfurivibrionaceae bacterium]